MEAKIKAITPARDNPRGSRLVAPLSLENPTNEVNSEGLSSSDIHVFVVFVVFVPTDSALHSAGLHTNEQLSATRG